MIAARKHGIRFVKVAIFALLALDVAFFMRVGTLNEVLDQCGWLILLIVFLYETSGLDQAYASQFEKYGLYVAQTIGYLLVIYTCATYWIEDDTSSFVNSAAWLAICVSIAYDVYAPGEYGGLEWRIRNAVKIILYTIVVGCAALWGWEGFESGDADDILSSYDALLWIACFAVVEQHVLDYEAEEEEAESAAAVASASRPG